MGENTYICMEKSLNPKKHLSNFGGDFIVVVYTPNNETK